MITSRVGQGILVSTVLLATSTARGQDDGAACIASHESAQQQRQRGKLAAAKQELERCSRDDCPALIAADCAKWWAEVQAALPSVIVAAPSGAEVRIDGQLVDQAASGREQVLDPGEHVVTATLTGHEPFEQRIALAEGDRGVEVTVRLEPIPEPPPAPPAPPPSPAKPAPDEATPTSSTGLGAWPWVAAAGLVSLGVFTGFAISGLERRGELDELECKPSCPQDDVDAMSRDFLVADVALGVGITGLVVAAVLYLTTGDDEAPATSRALQQRDGRAVLTF